MPHASVRASAIKKISRRVVPLLAISYLISYLDRINISFAALGMEKTFGMSPATYGFAAGIFYIGYVLAEVPSNILMLKVGARITSVVILRFLLGVAEAGFFPGILVYLTRWYPNRERARAMSTVLVAIPLSGLIGSPLNGWILSAADGVLGLAGWQWIFIAGGVPAVGVGVVFFVLLRDRPEDARWLSEEERAWLRTTLEAEEAERQGTAPAGHRAVFRNKVVLLLSAAFFLLAGGAYPLTYWLPSVLGSLGGHPVLDAADLVPGRDGRGQRGGADQFARQPGGLRQPVRRGVDPAGVGWQRRPLHGRHDPRQHRRHDGHGADLARPPVYRWCVRGRPGEGLTRASRAVSSVISIRSRLCTAAMSSARSASSAYGSASQWNLSTTRSQLSGRVRAPS
jgi:hypothetical protein